MIKYWTIREHKNSKEHKQHKHCNSRAILKIAAKQQFWTKLWLLPLEFPKFSDTVTEWRRNLPRQHPFTGTDSAGVPSCSHEPPPAAAGPRPGHRREEPEPAPRCPRSGSAATGTYQLLGFSPAPYLARVPGNNRGGFPAEQRRSAPGAARAAAGGGSARGYLYALYLWMARFTLRS